MERSYQIDLPHKMEQMFFLLNKKKKGKFNNEKMKKISRYIYLATYKYYYIYINIEQKIILFLIWRFKFSVIPIYKWEKNKKTRIINVERKEKNVKKM